MNTEHQAVLISELDRFLIVDAHEQKARVADLAADLLDGDHPPVTFLLMTTTDEHHSALPWSAVKRADYERCRFEVDDLRAAQPASTELLKSQVLLKRDVLDALVLDLENHRTTRANDLWLTAVDGKLTLAAADASLQAVFRRLSRGLLGRRLPQSLHDWKYIEFLQGIPAAVARGSGKELRVARMPAGEIASLIEAMPYLHAAELVKLLPEALAADVLEMMTDERELQVFEEMDDDHAVRLLALMAPDAAADLIARLPTEKATQHLEGLPATRSEHIIELLSYPEHSVGGVMTNDVTFAPASYTMREVREFLREKLRDPDFVYFIYAVDNEKDRRLLGVITLRELVVADDARLLEDLMNTYVTTLKPLDSARDAADRVLSSHVAALPVVGNDRRLIGIMTVDAAVAQAAPQSWSAQAPKIFS